MPDTQTIPEKDDHVRLGVAPRARRGGAPGPTPTPPNQNE